MKFELNPELNAASLEKACDLEGLDLVNDLLGLRLVETVRSDEYKGIKIDPEDGGTNKFYLNAADCKRLSEAFAVMAAGLISP